MVIKTLLKTVDAGSTVLTFTDEECTDDMIYDVYVDDIAVLPLQVAVSDHTVTVNFKEAQTSAVQVKIVVNALDGSLDASDIPYDATDTYLTADNVEDAIDELDSIISDNVRDIEQLKLDVVQAQTDIAGKADLFAVDESLMLSEGILSTEASIIPFDNSLIGMVSEDVQGAIEEAYNHGGENNYSTSEQVVGTWIDGQTLYKRTFVINNPIAGLNYLGVNDHLYPVKIYGGFVSKTTYNIWSLASRIYDNVFKLGVASAGYDASGMYVECEIGTSRQNISKLIVTIEYVKDVQI